MPMELCPFEEKRNHVRRRIASIYESMIHFESNLTFVVRKLDARLSRRDLPHGESIKLLDVAYEAALKIMNATLELEAMIVMHINNYIEINNDQIVHLELAKFFV
ncbi:unnamed protein product [Caenorhabditis brenneri]